MACDHKPLELEKHRVRLVIGGDALNYFGDPSLPAAALLEAKLLINSVISDSKKGARFMKLDIKDLFFNPSLKKLNTCIFIVNTFYKTSYRNVKSTLDLIAICIMNSTYIYMVQNKLIFWIETS